jgi:cell division transport system permease protein
VRFGFFFHEAVRALTRNAVPSFAAMATVLVTVLVLGVFIPVVQATTGAANEVRSRVIADVYLQPRSSPAEVDRVRGIIENETPHVARVEYVPKEKAIAAERKAGRGEYYDLLGSNPLPDLLRVTPDKPEDIVRVRDALAPMSPSGHRTVIDASIDEVKDRKENTDKILSATRVVKLTMGLLAGLLALASLLLVANTIRLSMYARRREVEVMKLVGATDWFIRWPFVIEGVLVGAMGGVAAIVLLGVVKISLVDPLAKDFALIAAPDTMNFGLLIAVLLGAAVAVSALGSGLSLRRFLRV